MITLVVALSGCRGGAYNDLYLENMAAEIRDLEDQLYEYDHEYRVLEQELMSIQAENQRLRRSAPEGLTAPPAVDSNDTPRGGSDSPRSKPQQPLRLPPGPVEPFDSADSPSIIEPNAQQPDRSTPTDGAPGSSMPRSNTPSTDILPSPPGSSGDTDFDLPDDFAPPSIDIGEPTPPPRSTYVPDDDQDLLAASNDLELSLSRIEVPAMLASTGGQTESASTGDLSLQAAGDTAREPARLTPAVEQVTDKRIVELGFHPSLSRAVNMDERSDDDGLYLVLQPKNERGQMVPVATQLTIVVLDPAREGAQARIGRWDYSAAQVQDRLQPIGANQGIHLNLPWNGPDPIADRVIVFVRYTFDDGRRVIGEKTLFVSSIASNQTVWMPRGTGNVAAASHQEPAAPQRVVRPGAAPASPAPAPIWSGNRN